MSRLLALWLAMLAAPAAAQFEPIEIRAEAVPVEAVQSARGVRVTGVWRLFSPHPGFGGFSGLMMAEGNLLMVSDRGWLVRWRPGGAAAETMPLPEACQVGAGDHAADAEAIALTPDGLELRIALERPSRLCGFSLERDAAAKVTRVDGMISTSGNRGVEAMATLPRRGIALLSETDENGAHQLAWFDADLPDDQAVTLDYLAPPGFKPADAAFLDDGSLLIVNRRFGVRGGRSTIVTLVRDFAPDAGRPIAGAELVRIERSLIAANYEGVAVDGSIVWLISDDNFASSKGTLLLRLELDGEHAGSAQGRDAFKPVQ